MTQPGIEPGPSVSILRPSNVMRADAHLVQPGLVSSTSVGESVAGPAERSGSLPIADIWTRSAVATLPFYGKGR